MTTSEFLLLLEKFERGACSAAEIDLLHRYCDDMQIGAAENAWSDEEREEMRRKLEGRIQSTIGRKGAKIKRLSIVKWVGYAACLAIVLSVGGYLYVSERSATHERQITENAIILELEDGTKQRIDEGGQFRIVDGDGNPVVDQQGNVLVYDPAEKTGEKASYNTLHVPYGKTFQVQLADGTTVHLNAGSSVTYPLWFEEGSNRQIELRGEAYVNVTKNSEQPFVVQVDQLQVRVLGTSFNVHAYPEDDVSEVVLLTGAVELSVENQANAGRNVRLKPGYGGTLDKATGTISTAPVVTEIYTSWMSGEMVFRNMTFENIFKKLERRYNVKIVNRNRGITHDRFNASFGKQAALDDVLDELTKMYGLRYEKENNTILINE